MGRRAFTISLLAFLGFVILQAVSAAEPSDKVVAEKDSESESLLQPSENQLRLIRSPDAEAKRDRKNKPKKPRNPNSKGKGKPRRGKRNRNGKPSGRRNGKPSGRRNKNGNGNPPRRNKNGNGKRPRGNRKGKGKTGGRNGGNRPGNKVNVIKKPVSGGVRQAACDEKELCKRIKLYIKYSNQQRKAKRILRTCKTMKNKAEKAASEFTGTASALKDSDDANVTAIQAKLEECAKTAKENCAPTNVAQCADAEQAKITACVTKLTTWINAFGPGAKSCLGQEKCCACINAITPAVPDDCLSYEALDKESLGKKNKCTKNEKGGGGKGSFGECRKLQQQAAEKGPVAFGKKCKGKDKMTTAKPSAIRQKVIKKILKT